MKPSRKLGPWLLVALLLVGGVILAISYTASPLSKLEINDVETISFTSGSFAPTGPPVSTTLPTTEHRRIIETLRAARVDWNPYKWRVAGKMEILSSNGEITVLDFYDTGANKGAFRIGKKYYRFTGDFVALTSSTADIALGKISIRLDGVVAVTHDEIKSVDWKSQSYLLTDAAYARLAEMNSSAPLVQDLCLTVDEEVVSTGYLVSTWASSFPMDRPVSHLPIDPDSVCPIVISGMPDPKNDNRLYTSLRLAGKLSE